MEFKKKLLLIDGHALFHRAYHALPEMRGPEGFPTGAIFGFLSMFFKALADINPTHALVTFDVPGPTFRDKLAADYKATRKPPPEDLNIQLPKLKEILAALAIPVYEKEGFEADDILGILSHKTPKDVLNIIVTGDLDLLQLINENTQIYKFKVGFSDIQIFDANKMMEVYGLKPSQWVDYKALRGDPSDNIPGVQGVGQKGATDLIQTFGNLDSVYEAAENADKNIKPATLKKLLADRDKAYLSQKLAHIDRTNNFEFNFEDSLLNKHDKDKVLSLLHSLGIKALDNRLPEY
jgi:DNA polymerase I